MHFVKKDIFRRRFSLVLFLCFAYAFALWAFQSYIGINDHYQLYYLRSYLVEIGYRANRTVALVGSFFGSPFGAGAFSGSTTVNAGSAGSIPVLTYHGILEKSDGVNVSLMQFRDQMMALKKAGYRTATLEDLHLFLQGKKILPAKTFFVTFDDGRKDSYYPSDPIFRALGFQAVMFAISDFSHQEEGTYYMTRREVQALAKNNRWSVQSHSSSHRNLTTITPDELEREIVDSKKNLEALIKKPIIAFAFPFGEFGQDESGFLESGKEAVTKRALEVYPLSFFQTSSIWRFTQNYPDPEATNAHYLVKRISVHPDWTGEDLVALLERGSAKPLPFRGKLNDTDGWIDTRWGEMKFQNNVMTLRAEGDGTGSATVLDGSGLWRDYQFSIGAEKQRGSNIYLWARYKDDHNYVACNFGQDRVHIEQTRNGNTSVIKGVEIEAITAAQRQNGFTAGIRVWGRTAECIVNGAVVVRSDFLNPALDQGGVGLKIWDARLGESSAVIKWTSVEPKAPPEGAGN